MKKWSIETNGPLIKITKFDEDGDPERMTFNVIDGVVWESEIFARDGIERCVLTVRTLDARLTLIDRGEQRDSLTIEEEMERAYLDAYSYAYRRGV